MNELCKSCVYKSDLISPQEERVCDDCEKGSKYVEELIHKLRSRIKELEQQIEKCKIENGQLIVLAANQEKEIEYLQCKYACDRRDSTGRCNMDCSRNLDSEMDLFEETPTL
ncbi:hypothetical protein KAR91_62875 [Candidatus Pacearchaeota archaeon]|nr:hypothetical protein [Candidatus Pacearchaeota archaeon]